jgi:hypothetical protein
MVRSLVLFMHVVGVLALFTALILEWVGWNTVRRSRERPEALASMRMNVALPRVYGIALATIIASGGYLGGRFGVLGDGWMLASYGGLVLIALSAAVRGREFSPSAKPSRIRAIRHFRRCSRPPTTRFCGCHCIHELPSPWLSCI